MLEIIPTHPLKVETTVPGSKSFTHRAVLLGALAKGESKILHPLFSDDTRYMMQALRDFGVDVIEHTDYVTIDGMGGVLKSPPGEIFVGNAGGPMRFLTTLAALAPDKTILTGNARMQERPIEELLRGLQQLGVNAYSDRNNGCPPIVVDGPGIPGGTCTMKGTVSSQYFSSIMLLAPYAQSDVTIMVEGEQVSKSYLDITTEIMTDFGVEATNANYESYYIKAGQRYQPRTYAVEADASSSSYFLAIAALTQSTIRVSRLNPRSAQGDSRFCDLLAMMGCQVAKGDNWIEVTGPEQLHGIEVDMNTMPDMVQTFAVVAACADGPSHVANVANLRVKETDRLTGLKKDLHAVGIKAEDSEDSLTIWGGSPHGGLISTFDDHRMAMAFAALGTRIPGIVIDKSEVVSKSYPNFWVDLERIGIQLNRNPS